MSKHLLPLLESAIRLAANAHMGGFDKAGVPYILHPLRVMEKMEAIAEKIVAVLHDSVEDTTVTFELLENEGYPKEIIDGIRAMTKIVYADGTKEPYEDFMQRCKANPIARKVKIRDMEDNSQLFRMQKLEDKHLKMIAKYHRGMQILQFDDVYIP